MDKMKYIKWIGSVLIGAFLSLYVTTDFNTDLIMNVIGGDADFEFSDFYERIEASREAKSLHPDILVVDIDRIDSREDIADIIDEVVKAGPKVVGVDVIFKGPKDSIGDSRLIEVMSQNADKIVAAVSLNGLQEKGMAYADDNILLNSLPKQSLGAANLISDKERGIIRSFVKGYDGRNGFYPSFAYMIAKRYASDDINESGYKEDKDVKLRLSDYEFRTIEPDKLISCRDLMRDKIVLIGDKSDRGDFHRTPVKADHPGVLIQAHIISTLLSGKVLTVASDAVTWILAIALSLIVNYLYIRMKKNNAQNIIIRLMLLSMVALGVIVGCYLYADCYVFLNVAVIILVIALSQFVLDLWYGAEVLFQWIKEKRKKQVAAGLMILCTLGGFDLSAAEVYTVYGISGVVTRKATDSQIKKGDSLRADEMLGLKRNKELTLCEGKTGRLYITTSTVDATPETIKDVAIKQSENLLKRICQEAKKNIRKQGVKNAESLGATYRDDRELDYNTDYIYKLITNLPDTADNGQNSVLHSSDSISLIPHIEGGKVWWSVRNDCDKALAFNILRVPLDNDLPGLILDCSNDFPSVLIAPNDTVDLSEQLFLYDDARYFLVASEANFDSMDINAYFFNQMDPNALHILPSPADAYIVAPAEEEEL